MAREKRQNIPGSIQHVIVRGIEQRELFLDDADREEFLKRLGNSIGRTDCLCYGWALMPNHIHLIIRTGTSTLGDLLRGLLAGYAMYYNKRYNRTGYLYQSRYKSSICQEGTYLLELIRYIHLSPIREKAINSMFELHSYSWTGHSALTGTKERGWQAVDMVLSYFGKTKEEAISKYRNFVETGFELDQTEGLLSPDQRLPAESDFVGRVIKVAQEQMEKRDLFIQNGWDLDRLAKSVCEFSGISVDDLGKKGRMNNISKAKWLISYWGFRVIGIKQEAIAQFLGVSPEAVSLSVRNGEQYAKECGFSLTV